MTTMADAETLSPETIAARVRELGPWFHNLDLKGVRTAPDHFLGDYPSVKFANFAHAIPADLTGKTVLDVGCNAGYYSFKLAERGAAVLAIDMDDHYLRQARWAAEQLDPDARVEFRRMTVYDLAHEHEQFDLILFLGVLYHLRHPLLAIDAVAERLRGTMIFQTLTMPGGKQLDLPDDLSIDDREQLTRPGWPRAAFIERSLAGDPTNWWAPNDACVQAMLRSAGLCVTGMAGHEIYVCQPDPDADHGRAARIAELRAATGC